MSVVDNLIFGRVNHLHENAQALLAEIVTSVVRDLKLADLLIIIFFANSQAGIGGGRIPLEARDRLNILRALVKRPDVLILHDAMPSINDESRHEIVQRINNARSELTVVNIIGSETSVTDFYDQRLVLDDSGMRRIDSNVQFESADASTELGHSASLCALEAMDVFSVLSLAQKKLLSLHGKVTHELPATVMYDYGDAADYVYIFIAGRARLFRADTENVLHIEEKTLVGEVEVFAGSVRQSRLETQSNCEVIRLESVICYCSRPNFTESGICD